MVSTYHCLCTELVLASGVPLAGLPKRIGDGAMICEISDPNTTGSTAGSLTTSVSFDGSPVILKLEDGFEKRHLARCRRCNLTLGYQLDRGQYEGHTADTGRNEDVLYIIPGGLIETHVMESGKRPSDKEVEVAGHA